MILTAFRRGFQNRTIHALYGMIVAQARSPVFYADYGVPDSVQDRFDLIVLHLVLVLARLSGDHELRPGPGRHSVPSRARSLGQALGQTLGQVLFDAFCRDLDANLREMGVGDLARFGEAFYSRQAAYGCLRRRWHAISLRPPVSMTGRPGWHAMRARR